MRLVKETNYVELGADEVFLQFAPISFDASTFELWGSLLNGAKLVVFPAGRPSLEELGQVIQDKAVTTLWLTSALFNQMVDNHLASLSGLRQLLAGGEALSLPQVKKMLDQLDGRRLINGYGPTENTTFTCCHVMSGSSDLGQSVPIGRPISNTTVYILDEQMGPVPVGVPGELYIGGDGLARDYLNQPELTAQKFVANPFSDKPGARLFRTGDEVRYLRDGTIEFLGRFDHQVKIRGFRIELGEIETVLSSHELVQDAVVIVREDEPGDKRLVAYLLKANDAAPTVETLRQHIKASLPEYMLPAMFVILDELPLTPNGKLDRDALPVPGDERESLEIEYTAPRNELEQQLAEIWAEVLKLERVGIHDNFFDLGGHSLLATQIVSRISEQLDVELPLSDLFDYPTVAELAAVDKLAGDMPKAGDTAILDARTLQARTDLSVDGATFPMSFAQERLWYIHALYPDVGAAYNIPFVIQLDSSVDEIEVVLERLQQQHAILRTSYIIEGAQPVQKVNQNQKISLRVIDISDFTEGDVQGSAFDLETGPVWRSTIVKQNNRVLALAICIHHIAADGWSMNVLRRDILRLCQQVRTEAESTDTKSAIQYVDYALWHREQLNASRLEVLQAYWTRQLNGIPSAIDLPIDKSRPPIFSHSGAFEFVSLSAAQSDALRRFAKDNEVTLFILMLAIFKLLLSRYAQQTDIVVGTAVSGRTLTAMDDIIGLFVNSLVLRTDLAGSQNFTQLLRNVRKTTFDAFEHQDLPFEKIVEIVQPERDLSRNPVFQVMFLFNVVEELSEEEARQISDNLSEEIISGDVAGSHVDLALSVKDEGSRLSIGFDYNDDLFEAATIRRMMTHYRSLLDVSIAAPKTPIDQFELFSDAEKQLILYQWNQTQVDYDKNETLCSLFEQQVNRTPQSIAVSYEEQSLDYSQLAQKANQIACLLSAKNVGPGDLVGIYIERSIDLIVAILGILKAGAAYVPLDPENPEERVRYIISDSNVRVLLSQKKFENQLPSDGPEIVLLDSIKLNRQVKPQALPVVTEDMLAYVIYTSGSTGKPKGVMVTHSSVVNHACWMRDLFKIDQTDRVLQKSPSSFDASVCEIFVPLFNGARVVLAVPGGDKDSDYLIQEIEKHEITTLILVPSALRMLLLRLTDRAALRTLKRMGCGGEALTQDLQQEYYEKCNAPLYNLYGPTESTIDTTSFLCEATFNHGNVPIGYPVSNTRTHVLDPQLRPVPIGVNGELHIGGAGLARGYLNRPEMTAEKFIKDPFSDDSDARLYKTGDLVRYRADGSIEFIGRIDQQMKVRGFRIELGEIETVLADHAAVRDSVVVAREDMPGEKRLVAYVVTDEGEPDVALMANMRAFLRARLPDYMVPSAFMVLDSIPLSTSGKLDQLALPKPDGERLTGEEFVEPRTDLERQVVAIWQDVLGLEQVGVYDNFFDLGGHSLKLVELHNRLDQEIDTKLSLVDLFAYPTVSTLVEHIVEPKTIDVTRAEETSRVSNLSAGKQRLHKMRQKRQQSAGIKG